MYCSVQHGNLILCGAAKPPPPLRFWFHRNHLNLSPDFFFCSFLSHTPVFLIFLICPPPTIFLFFVCIQQSQVGWRKKYSVKQKRVTARDHRLESPAKPRGCIADKPCVWAHQRIQTTFTTVPPVFLYHSFRVILVCGYSRNEKQRYACVMAALPGRRNLREAGSLYVEDDRRPVRWKHFYMYLMSTAPSLLRGI